MISDRPSPTDSARQPQEEPDDGKPEVSEARRRAAEKAADQVAATLRTQSRSVRSAE